MSLLLVTLSTQPSSAAVNIAPGASWATSGFGRSGEVSAFSLAAQAPATIFYVGRWIGVAGEGITYWGPEHPVDHLYDLRTIADQSTPPTVNRTQCCLLAVSSTPIVADGWVQVAASPTSRLPANLSGLENRLDRTPGSLTAQTMGELAFELMVEDAPLSLGFKPLSPNRNGVWSLRMGDIPLYDVAVKDSPAAWDVVVKRIESDYAAVRARSLAAGSDLYLKYLETQARRYRVDYREFLGDLPDEGTREPATTHTDDFDCANSDTFGCDLTWTEVSGDCDIAGNQGRLNSSSAFCRAEHDVSTDDMNVQMVVDSAGGNRRAGASPRFGSAASPNEDFYACALRNGTINTYVIQKRVGGTFTQIANASGSAPTFPDTLRCEVDGSDLELFWSGTSELTATDSALSGQTRGGISNMDSVASADIDDWQINDLGAAPAARNRLIVID